MTDTELLPGPIDYVLLEFPGDVPLDGAAAELLALVDSGIVSVWDLVAIRKEADGTFSGIALDAIHESFTAFEGARSGLLGDDDIAEAAAALEPGTVAVLIVWENAWAERFVTAAFGAGGAVVASGRIPAAEVIEALDLLESE
ncbi:MAG TPA: DUF6325 family protein [Microthrixaceae bacterium]|nr:hypothetical protein [Microthrixaceae bacterium]RTL06907.1 MAG: DUF1269 domain-containing protein [Acidimicrobiia bacterium]MCB9374901.1 DUF1269 domain-containing protein [Microthrixaceae bacterium]MCB9400954.1 DUF1269 domain-containing protein [Microthrixaceae bacterium]MCO5304931.1 DUF6325 family protein [Microthrixaceae bacterium]